MVLNRSRALSGAVLAVSAGAIPAALSAQTLPDIAPAIARFDPEYEPAPIDIGPVRLSIDGNVRIEYDDNVFALPDNPTSDGIAVASLEAGLQHRAGAFTAKLDASVTARRFFEETSQDSEAMRVRAGLAWEPHQEETFEVSGTLQRAVEDRGDPEARLELDRGPRLIDIASVVAGYHRARGKLLFDLTGEVTELDAVDRLDDDRDFTVYGGTAKLGVRTGGRMYATATAFVSVRDFRLATDFGGINRDATIYGARAGIEFIPGGFFEGSISAGVFRNEPSDPQLTARTGFSLNGLLTYRPTRRMALVLNAFNGDVATFRGGTSGRTDTVLRLVWQHEIRHNLLSSVSAGYRKSDFIESGIEEQTFIASGGLEYLMTRNLSLVGNITYGTRESDLARDEFERLRANIGIRFRF